VKAPPEYKHGEQAHQEESDEPVDPEAKRADFRAIQDGPRVTGFAGQRARVKCISLTMARMSLWLSINLKLSKPALIGIFGFSTGTETETRACVA
jgi:hypothetical protein